jgi:cytochrome c biogenesis protein CcdA/thiol-disulfide isomerase/thioredoxin
MLLLILFAFLAGVVTVLSPCILPLLPIILSSSDGKDTGKPLGIVAGFIGSFTFFTLFLSSIVLATGISADSLRFVSVVVLAVFGLSLVLPQVQAQMEVLFSKLASFAPSSVGKSGFFGGVTIGLSLGLLWTPCVGPILASVISLAITGSVSFSAFFITLAYAVGTALPMFGIMLAGSTALKKVPWLVRNTARIQKVFGVLMILTALGIANTVDRQFQSYILKTFPSYGVGLTRFEENKKVKEELEKRTQQSEQAQQSSGVSATQKLTNVTQKKIPAPELIAGGQWFNSPPLTLQELRGKVVLVDFWTYSCINCRRTFPYLKTWWEAYKDQGLVIIGVHSPEFEFEKDPKNVQKALDDFGLSYPVMQDNVFATWKAYRNQYWPAKYLIDAEGNVRYTHFGEGKYDETESKIQELLKEAGELVVAPASKTSQPDEKFIRRNLTQTPETYLGYARSTGFVSPEKLQRDALAQYSLPKTIARDSYALEGSWMITPEYARGNAGGKLVLKFDAREVYLVARPVAGESMVQVTLDGAPSDQQLSITADGLYTVVSLEESGLHILELEFGDTVELYAFTFG